MLIVDAHEDIAYNAIFGARDFRLSVADKRKSDPRDDQQGREGLATVGLPDLLNGNVAVVFGTLYASPARSAFGGEQRQGYTTPKEAEAQARAQLDYYRRLADEDGRVALIGTRSDLDAHLAVWQSPDAAAHRVGIVPLMEGADPIGKPDDVKRWFDDGVRIVGLSWSQSRYAGGTRAPGPLSDDGKKLLQTMNEVGLVWDVSHLADESFWQGLDIFQGRIIASHSNCRQYVPTDRHLSDDMIRALIERDAVIGCVLYNRFLQDGWEPSKGKQAVTLKDDVMRHIDRICQMAGNAQHVGIGSDFDGGFGAQSIPAELDSVADLPKLADTLKSAGYKPADVEAVMGGNWIRMLKETLPH
ncbi:MAG: membrane dipeptidase [Chloroflexota bacterium]